MAAGRGRKGRGEPAGSERDPVPTQPSNSIAPVRAGTPKSENRT